MNGDGKTKKIQAQEFKLPEPLNAFHNFIWGMIMASAADSITYNRRKKKSKVNPYTAVYIANGIKGNNDIGDTIRLGAILDATGAYDNEPKNRYAWRMNCEDGSAYGIYPENYETRGECNAALHCAKMETDDNLCSIADVKHQSVSPDENIADLPCYLYCRISRLDSGRNMYYLTSNPDLKIGSTVTVPTENGVSSAIVLAVERHTRLTAPQPPEETEKIIEVS